MVAGLGIAGLAVGFAAQSTLANFIAGITILLEQSFQVGDWVNINGNEGRVVVIALRTTHVLTRDNITVIREENGLREYAKVDLTSRAIFDSPYYYLHKNDVVYIEPVKARMTYTDRSVQLIPVITGIVSALGILVLNLTR